MASNTKRDVTEKLKQDEDNYRTPSEKLFSDTFKFEII